MTEMSDERRTAMLQAISAEMETLQEDLFRIKQRLDACERRIEAIEDDEEDRQRKPQVPKTDTGEGFWGDESVYVDPRD
jgi:hypothetical protein